MTLGLHPGIFYRNARSHCINILLSYGEGCYANCAYCGLARGRKGKYQEKSFIKVDWPLISLDKIIERIVTNGRFVDRVCISMITNKRALRDVKKVSSRIKSRILQPLSILISPTIMNKRDLIDLKKAGVDRIGVAVDLASKELFEKFRGKDVGGPHKWDDYWDNVIFGREIFGSWKTGVHLIVGMGEREEEMIEIFDRCLTLEAEIHLFSFFAESGSALSDHPKPPISVYRRMQLASFLMSEGYVRKEDFEFDSAGRISGFGLDSKVLGKYIDMGVPFMTSGCRAENGNVACNRPYGNCLPGSKIRNYPFLPNEDDLARIKGELCQY